MYLTHGWNETFDKAIKPLPVLSVPLASAHKRMSPRTADVSAQYVESAQISGYGVVVKVSLYHAV